jgi:hypothetical protein
MNSFILKITGLVFFSIIVISFDLFYTFDYRVYVNLFFLELLFLVYRYKRFTIIIILLLFSSLWGLEFIITDLLGWGISSGIVISELKLFYMILIIAYLPLFFLNIPVQRNTDFNFRINKWVYYLVFFFACFITIFKINGVVVLGGSNGGYSGYVDNLDSGSGLIEYVLILFSYLFLFKDLTRLDKFFRLLIVLIFILKCNLFGFRIQGIMAILLIFYVFFAKKISAFKTILIFFPTVIIAMLLGLAKHTDNLELSLLLNNDAIESTHMGTVISGTIALKSYPINYFNSILSLITWILPPSMLSVKMPELYPSVYSQKFLGAAGGMPFPVTGYLIANFIGVFIFGLMAALFIYIILNSEKNNFLRYLSMVVITFFPRWILYDFVNFGIRTLIYSCILFLILSLLDKSMKCKNLNLIN